MVEGEIAGVSFVKNPAGSWPDFVMGGDSIGQDQMKIIADAVGRSMII